LGHLQREVNLLQQLLYLNQSVLLFFYLPFGFSCL
jgi:hypothetical protein